MPFESLTEHEQSDLQLHHNNLRHVARTELRWWLITDPERLKQFADDVVAPIVVQLDPTDVVPNPGDLPGAQDLTRTELVALENFYRAIDTLITDNMPLLIKACGPGQVGVIE